MSNDLIVKDNRLISAKYHFTKIQARFIAFMSAKIGKDDMDFFTYNMSINDLISVLDIERSNLAMLSRALKELVTKLVVIQEDENVIEATALLSYFKINRLDNSVEYRFDKSMKPFLLQLTENFTKLSLEKVLNFDSAYSIRMYEILQSRASKLEKYKNVHLMTFKIDLQELKEVLLGTYNIKTDSVDIPKSYERFSQFKQKILEPSYKELKEKGDYYFEYEPIKTSRAVTSIKFTIIKNANKIKEDFKEKKKQHLLNGKEKQIAQEQIRRIIERTEAIKDSKKFETALYKKYLSGDLGYDKDLQIIKNTLDREELENILKQYKGIKDQEDLDKKVHEREDRIKKFKENLKKDKDSINENN